MGTDVAQPAQSNLTLTVLNQTILYQFASKNVVFFLKRLKLKNVTTGIRSAEMGVALPAQLKIFIHVLTLTDRYQCALKFVQTICTMRKQMRNVTITIMPTEMDAAHPAR